MKLSIVIPAYNVEQYIGRCLDSIFNQQIETDMLEVIVVNDGSKDRTEDIIKQYASQHPNLIYISQENQGQSVARNSGLKQAKGDLVWYVDSDDATTPNSINTIFSYFNKYPNADFLTFDRIHFNLEDHSKKYCKSWGGRKATKDIYEKKLNGKEANSFLLASVPWFHVYKRSFLIQNSLYFIPNLLHEDDEIQMRLYFYAKEVRYIPFAHYIYSAMRPGSLTTINHTFTMKSAESSIKTIKIWKKFELENVKTKKQKRFVNSFIKSKYQSLVLLANRKDDTDLYSLYLNNKKKWRKGYVNSYKKSISFGSFTLIGFIRVLVSLYFPQHIDKISLSALKKVLH